jgi:hypothetical protein
LSIENILLYGFANTRTRTEQQNRIESELKQLIELSKTKSLKGHFEINFIRENYVPLNT